MKKNTYESLRLLWFTIITSIFIYGYILVSKYNNIIILGYIIAVSNLCLIETIFLTEYEYNHFEYIPFNRRYVDEMSYLP